jgi:hypothetical protein
MTHAALIDAVQRKAGEAVDAVWRQARADAERLRSDAARLVEEERGRAAQAVAAAARETARVATAGAERQAQRIRTAAKTALAERLHRLARQALPRFRDDGYPGRFAALAGELPPRRWTRIAVNPADQPLARARFPDAAIEADAAIAGGLRAEGDGVLIGNTLEARLDAAWPDRLAGLLHDVEEALGG